MNKDHPLICPYCNHAIEITWGRYWKSMANAYQCPKCDMVSAFQTSPRWIQCASWSVQILPLLALFVAPLHIPWYFLFVYPVIFVLDRQLDQRYGKLVENKTAQEWLSNKSKSAVSEPLKRK